MTKSTKALLVLFFLCTIYNAVGITWLFYVNSRNYEKAHQWNCLDSRMATTMRMGESIKRDSEWSKQWKIERDWHQLRHETTVLKTRIETRKILKPAYQTTPKIERIRIPHIKKPEP